MIYITIKSIASLKLIVKKQKNHESSDHYNSNSCKIYYLKSIISILSLFLILIFYYFKLVLQYDVVLLYFNISIKINRDFQTNTPYALNRQDDTAESIIVQKIGFKTMKTWEDPRWAENGYTKIDISNTSYE